MKRKPKEFALVHQVPREVLEAWQKSQFSSHDMLAVAARYERRDALQLWILRMTVLLFAAGVLFSIYLFSIDNDYGSKVMGATAGIFCIGAVSTLIAGFPSHLFLLLCDLEEDLKKQPLALSERLVRQVTKADLEVYVRKKLVHRAFNILVHERALKALIRTAAKDLGEKGVADLVTLSREGQQLLEWQDNLNDAYMLAHRFELADGNRGPIFAEAEASWSPD